MDLHGEIVEALKIRADLFKWKLILVAGLGAAASGRIGTTTSIFPPPGYALALIPLVCLYVDLLCIDQTLRVVVISKYLQLLHEKNRNVESNPEYAAFVSKVTRMNSINKYEILTKTWGELKAHSISAYFFFALAQYSSTLFFDVCLIGCAPLFRASCRQKQILMASSIIGLGSLLLMYVSYKKRFLAVQKCELNGVREARQ